MFVELLKHPKASLEDEWHPIVPSPRYSRKLARIVLTHFCASSSSVQCMVSERKYI